MATPRRGAASSSDARGAIRITTPGRRAQSLEPSSPGRFSIQRTPLDRSVSRDLRNSVLRTHTPGSSRRSNAPTPHARAAMRDRELRRAALLTPGRKRRMSGREKRESMLDVLRGLGRVLAPGSKPVETSSSPVDGRPTTALAAPQEDDDDEDDLLLGSRPRLSLPIDEDDDDDLQPPRSAGLEDVDYTMRSIEAPRRAHSEQPFQLSRRSGGSFGSIRFSDAFRLGGDDVPSDFSHQLVDDLDDVDMDGRARPSDAYERVDEFVRRESMVARESDFGFQVPLDLDGNETTFLIPFEGQDQDKADASSAASEYAAADSPLGDGRLPEGQLEVWPQGTEIGDEDAIAVSDGLDEITDAIADAASGFGRRGARQGSKRKQRTIRISKHDLEYPPLPPAFVKRVAQACLRASGLRTSKLKPDTLAALTRASDFFFNQLGDDLGVYANHAGRKTIDESDVLMLMKRQRVVDEGNTVFSLAQGHLPRELLQDIRMPAPAPPRKRRRRDAADAVSDET